MRKKAKIKPEEKVHAAQYYIMRQSGDGSLIDFPIDPK